MKKFFSLMIMLLVFMSVALVGCKNPTNDNSTKIPTNNATFDVDTLINKGFYAAANGHQNFIYFRCRGGSQAVTMPNDHADYVTINGDEHDIVEINQDQIILDNTTPITYVDADHIIYDGRTYERFQ